MGIYCFKSRFCSTSFFFKRKRKSDLRDFEEPNYDEIIRKFIMNMSESLKNLKFNTNRGIIKN